MHPNGGVASDGVKLILWAGCDEERLTFHFLAQGKNVNKKATLSKKDFNWNKDWLECLISRDYQSFMDEIY